LPARVVCPGSPYWPGLGTNCFRGLLFGPEEDAMKCPKCGRPNRPGMIQCSRCFTMLLTTEQPQSDSSGNSVVVHRFPGCAKIFYWILGIAGGLFLLLLLAGLLRRWGEA